MKQQQGTFRVEDNTSETFEEFQTRYHDRIRPGMIRDADALGLRFLEDVALKLTFVCEKKRLVFETEPVDTVLQSLLAKASQEVFAYVGAFRSGSLVGAYHHFRAIIELRAAVVHLFGRPQDAAKRSAKKTLERCEKFVEWPHVSGYSAYRRALLRLEETPDDLEAKARFELETRSNKHLGQQSEETLARWAKTYARGKADEKLENLKAGHVHEWHSPASIMGLIEELDTPDRSAPLGWYEVACNATHVSPAAHALAAVGGIRMLSWDAEHAAISLLHMFCHTLYLMDELSPHCRGALTFENEWRELKKMLKAAAESRSFASIRSRESG